MFLLQVSKCNCLPVLSHWQVCARVRDVTDADSLWDDGSLYLSCCPQLFCVVLLTSPCTSACRHRCWQFMGWWISVLEMLSSAVLCCLTDKSVHECVTSQVLTVVDGMRDLCTSVLVLSCSVLSYWRVWARVRDVTGADSWRDDGSLYLSSCSQFLRTIQVNNAAATSHVFDGCSILGLLFCCLTFPKWRCWFTTLIFICLTICFVTNTYVWQQFGYNFKLLYHYCFNY